LRRPPTGRETRRCDAYATKTVRVFLACPRADTHDISHARSFNQPPHLTIEDCRCTFGTMPVTPKSILSDTLRGKLSILGSRLEQQLPINHEFDGVLAELNKLSPAVVVRADHEIALAGNLQKWRRQIPLVVRLFSSRMRDMDQLAQVDDLKFLFIFHKDGCIREAALKRIDAPIPSPFLFAAIAWRLNDWVAPVRQAAALCASRCFGSTSPVVIAEAAILLQARENSWGRWSDERRALVSTFYRADVGEAMVKIMRSRSTGPMATMLRYALRENSLDSHLESLAREAIQPAVRAAAAQALIDGQASWPSGWIWRWINKPMGLRRRDTTYSHRRLVHNVPRIPMIEVSAADPSALVRRVAVASLIRHQVEASLARRIAAPLLTDQASSVRERAEFIFKTRPEA
jgi:hypothetical protein